ncbi:MAG: hypothetical protein ABR974_13470 [Bacteroidales bacterium]
MNKKNRLICLFSFIIMLNLIVQGQGKKNIVGIGVGVSPTYENAVWIGSPINTWVTKNVSPVFQVFYARQVLEAVRLGSYFEYENATLGSTNIKASRYNVGLNWLAQYPNTAFHAQLGGYVGYGYVTSSNWDQSLYGSDIGIMVGPAFEKGNIGIALHLQYGKAYYTSSGAPDEVGLAIPRILLKVYYKF